jgi:SpoVK/Ycf46/Vps4 family AAA+-type ATPase
MTNGLPGAGRAIMILSCMDVLLEASSRMDLEHLKRFMFKHVFQCESTGRSILVIDDLDAIFDKDDDDVMYSGDNDDEKRIARNAVLGVMDDINMDITGSTPFILGLSSRDTMTQCVDLARVGRFEKIVTMSPPTELQRIEILKSMFQSLPIDCNRTDIDEASKEQLCRKWSTIIARYTSGCVAADLKRMCVQALTRSKARVGTHLNSNHETNVARIQWSDIREAARDCIPSQLSNLDVTLAKNIDIDFAECTESLRDSFFRTWDAKFAGYSELKAKIYRTIIWPWKRQEAFLNGTWNRTITDLERDVPPPTGVLFHGQSGTGKTFAAECLACSLGLNVIRVSSCICIKL